MYSVNQKYVEHLTPGYEPGVFNETLSSKHMETAAPSLLLLAKAGRVEPSLLEGCGAPSLPRIPGAFKVSCRRLCFGPFF